MSKNLTQLKINGIKNKGRYADGDGLYLQVSASGTKSWIFRYQLKGTNKRREMGLGSLSTLSLSEAREEILKHKKVIAEGRDPKIKRDKEVTDTITRQSWTFAKCADEYIKTYSPSWKNAKHKSQWVNTLATYANPVIGHLPVEEIDNALVMMIIEPIWLTKNETANRVRNRVERILGWAIVREYRSFPNPAAWKGNLEHLLSKPSEITKVKNHAALPYAELPIFYDNLKKRDSVNALALQFIILTACRTGEVISASWDEIDLIECVWTIPETRTKTKVLHRVPLSSDAVKVLNKLPKSNGWLFPGKVSGKHISNIAMLNLLKRQLDRPDLTVHGFRSTFRDWTAETTNHPRRIAEKALGHALQNKTEAAYQRGELLEKRRLLMQDYCNYANSLQDNVIAINI